MAGRIVEYEADGLRMRGELFAGGVSGPARPGVLVFPEAFGVSDHSRERAERLAGLGYQALACDLHGDARYEGNLENVMSLIAPLRSDPEAILRRARPAMEALIAQGGADPARIAAMGFCFGGTMALELARGGAPLRAAIGFHSGLAPRSPEEAKPISGEVLVCLGADDPSIDGDQRAAFEQEMKAVGAKWQMSLYGGVVHSFTNPAADQRGMTNFARYDARADARSWAETVGLLRDVFAG